MQKSGMVKLSGAGKSGDEEYNIPENPEIHIHNDENMTMEIAVNLIIDYLEKRGLLDSPPDVATAEAESAKRVKEGQDIKEKRLLRELDEKDAAVKAAVASGNSEQIEDARKSAALAAGALKSFIANKYRAIDEAAKAAEDAAAAKAAEAEEANKLAQATRAEAAKLAQDLATYDAETSARTTAN